jgi:hypothetical protein
MLIDRELRATSGHVGNEPGDVADMYELCAIEHSFEAAPDQGGLSCRSSSYARFKVIAACSACADAAARA